MKRFDRKAYCLLPLLALIVLCLAACGGGLDAQLRPKAEAYLKTLAEKAGVQDSFTLTKDKADTPEKADPIGFTARSEKYQKDFTVYVSRDGSTVTDSYYTLSMRDLVFREGMAMMEEALGSDFPETQVALLPVPQESLSGRTFASLEEFTKASGSLILLQFDIRGDGKTQLTPEQIDKILMAMQAKGFRATLYPYISNAVWYDVTPDGIWVTTRTGADGGKMLERKEYTPLTDK